MNEEIKEKYLQAGKIAAKAMKKAGKLCTPNRKMLEICEKVEEFIRKEGAENAFPLNVSVNEVAAHYTATVGDQNVLPNETSNSKHGSSENENIVSELIDVKDHLYTITTPPWGEGGADKSKTKWKEIMEHADALVIVTPEYNHSYPGELKLLLDSLYEEYEKKPVGVCGVSAGGLGGARVALHIKQVLIELKMIPARNSVYFSNVKDLFNESGTIKDTSYGERVGTMLEEIFWYTSALRKGTAQ